MQKRRIAQAFPTKKRENPRDKLLEGLREIKKGKSRPLLVGGA